jgi:DNA-binding transcriptional regulator YdaS (Cro superfamily)
MTLSTEFVAGMYAEYQSGDSLNAVARRHGYHRASLPQIFRRRGLALRPWTRMAHDPITGQWIPAKPATAAEITAMIQQLTRVVVPTALAREWRQWPMARRMQFIARVRRHINHPDDRPTTPFSSNVDPFEYGSPRAMAIAKTLNAGKDSQHSGGKIKPASQGVIYRGRLFFWGGWDTGYTVGPYLPGIGRPALHHVVWSEVNGRPVPPKHTVIFLDGNKNNFTPRNLGLRAMADCMRQNSCRAKLKKSRGLTALLLNTHNANSSHTSHERFDTIKAIRSRHRV